MHQPLQGSVNLLPVPLLLLFFSLYDSKPKCRLLSLLFDIFKTLFNSLSYCTATWRQVSMTPTLYPSLMGTTIAHSCSPLPLDLPHSAHLLPPTWELAPCQYSNLVTDILITTLLF